MKKWLLLFLLLAGVLRAQWPLSAKAEISLVTCGPGQSELYSAFGHTAVRVYDPNLRLNMIFNYGVFDFDQPNFYLNFAKGNLLYQLATADWDRFKYHYLQEGRSIHEQVLNLDSAQAQAYFNFLMKNAQPENRDYYYDYFYDNCATRVRDGLIAALPEANIAFPEQSQFQPSLSIRGLCDEYLTYQPWGDFAIDFCLGLPMDREADAHIEMFLPDLLEASFADAKLTDGNGERPLVKETRIIAQDINQYERPLWNPMFFFAALLVIGVLLTIFFYQKPQKLRLFDFGLFFGSGLLGLFLMALWFLTDHKAAANNFNILVFLPLNIIFSISLWKGAIGGLARKYFGVLPYFYALLLASWLWIPQELHLAVLPFVALLILRSWYISYRYPKN